MIENVRPPTTLPRGAFRGCDRASIKTKDAYDIYYSVRNSPDGIGALVEATRPLLDVHSARRRYCLISEKFRDVNDFGPTNVRSSWKVPTCLAVAQRINGSRTPSDKLTHGFSGLGLR